MRGRSGQQACPRSGTTEAATAEFTPSSNRARWQTLRGRRTGGSAPGQPLEVAHGEPVARPTRVGRAHGMLWKEAKTGQLEWE